MILVVDDSLEIIDWLGDVIQKAGYYFDSAPNGTVALYKMQRIYYALAFIDIVLPDFYGDELAARIKALPEPFCHIPAVAMTGGTFLDIDGLFCAVMQKPFLPRDLREAILRYARPPIPDLHLAGA